MQNAEIRNISQKCKEKQDALEMKDKQVRILLSDFSWCLFWGFFVCFSVSRVANFYEDAASVAFFTASSTQCIFRTLSVKQELLRGRCMLHSISCLIK